MVPSAFDSEVLRAQMAHTGNVSIADFLPERDACDLLADLETRGDWLEVFHAGGSTYEMAACDYSAMEPEQRERLDGMVWTEAAKGFQFRIRTVRVPDEIGERLPSDALHRFAQTMCASETLGRFAQLLDSPELNFADAQATAYSAGHFLNGHDDAVEGKGRVAAYVYSLTRDWSPDWGGHLIFPDGEGLSGLMPQFNTLRVFTVPRLHSVTFVPPFVTATRYSITGWLRVI